MRRPTSKRSWYALNRRSLGLRLEQLEPRRLLAAEQLMHVIPNPDTLPQEYAEFGAEVATDGVRAIVAAPYAYLEGFTDAGIAYLLDLENGGDAIPLQNPSPDYYELHGYSVGIDGALAVVGAPEDGPGSVHVYDATNGNLLRTISNPHASQTVGFGDAVAISGTTLVVGLPNLATAYVYDASSGALLHTIADPEPSSGDQFGSAVAISGSNILIADIRQTVGALENVGNAHLFDVTSGALLQTFANPTPAAGDYFGNAVAIDGDTVVIGASSDDAAGEDAGTAYVFNALSGAVVHTLASPSPVASEYFGDAVSVAAGKVFAGAPGGSASPLAGAVYVFDSIGGGYLSTLTDPDPRPAENFGSAVAASDTRTVVGAIYSQVSGLEAGQAFVYAASGQLEQIVDSPVLGFDQYFGITLDISGDIAVVGGYHGAAGYGGKAHVFDFTTGQLLHVMSSPEPQAGYDFGSAVAISGNVIAVGDGSADDRGAVYLFDATTGSHLRTLRETGGELWDQFGSTLAMDGNLLAVSQGGSTGNLPVLVYDISTGDLVQTLADPNLGTGLDGYGGNLAIEGRHVLVGAPYTNDSHGVAYLFDAITGQLLQTFANPTPEMHDRFGNAVAIRGNLAVVGAYLDNTQADSAGAAYVFDITTGALQWTLLEPAATAQYDDRFGQSVAISDTSIYVAASLDDSGGGVWGGAVHVFDAATGAYQQRLTYPDPAEYDYFGDAMAVDVHRLVVAADEVDGGTWNRGAVYFYAAPAVLVESADALSVAENGSPDQEQTSFTVALSTPPASPVAITVSSGDTGALTVEPATLTFTAANYNVPQTVTLTGVVDNLVEATQNVAVTIAVDAANSDDAYDAVADQTVDVAVLDVPLRPVVSGPLGATQDALPTFTFAEVAGATSYNLWLIDLANPATAVYSSTQIAGSPFTLPAGAELPEGSYRYFLSANNAVGFSQWSGPHDFAIGGAPIAPPAPTAATGTTTTSNASRPQIQWPASTDASHYAVWLINRTSGQLVESATGLTTPAFVPSTDLADGVYRIWISASNAMGSSGFGEPFDFTVGQSTPTAPPAKPTAVSATGDANRPTISWPAEPTAASYSVYLVNLDSGQAAAYERGLTTPAFTPAAPLPTARYRIFVSAENAAGSSGFGSPFDFDAGTVSVPDAPTGLTALNTDTPRPTLSWNASAGAASYSLYVINLETSAVVASIASQTATTFTPATDLATGTYRYWVRAHNGKGSSPFSAYFDFALAPVAPLLAGLEATQNDQLDPAQQPSSTAGDALAPAVKASGFASQTDGGNSELAGAAAAGQQPTSGDAVGGGDSDDSDDALLAAVDRLFAQL